MERAAVFTLLVLASAALAAGSPKAGQVLEHIDAMYDHQGNLIGGNIDSVSPDSLYWKAYTSTTYLYSSAKVDSPACAPRTAMSFQNEQATACMDPNGDYVYEVNGSNLRRFSTVDGTHTDFALSYTGGNGCATDGQYIYVPSSSISATIYKYTMTGTYVNSTTLDYTADAYAISCVNDTVWACPDRYAHIYYGYDTSKFTGGSITNDATWDVGSGTNGVGNIAFDGTCYYIAWIGASNITFKRFYRDRTLYTSGTVDIDSRSVMCRRLAQGDVHDVGARAIIAPVDTIDSGTVITPTALVVNFGTSEETFLTRFTIGSGYTDTVTATLAAHATDTLSFADWTANPLGTFAVKCTTELAGDENPADDRAEDSVVVVPFTGIEAGRSLPAVLGIDRILPNPTAGRTKVRCNLPRPTAVSLSVYSATGTLVQTIAAGEQNPGWYDAAWDGTDLRGREVAPGVYLVRLEAGAFTSTRTLVVQR